MRVKLADLRIKEGIPIEEVTFNYNRLLHYIDSLETRIKELEIKMRRDDKLCGQSITYKSQI